MKTSLFLGLLLLCIGWARITKLPFHAESANIPSGWLPYAYVIGDGPTTNYGNNDVLGANGGFVVAPVYLTAPMSLYSVSVRNKNSSGERSWNWFLFKQDAESGDPTNNGILNCITYGAGSLFVASGANNWASACAGENYLAPGLYWIIIQNTHASNTFSLAVANAGDINYRTVTNGTASIIDPDISFDMTDPSYYGQAYLPAIRLDGWVFGSMW